MTLMRKMMELRRLRGRVAANAPLFEVAGRPLTAERLSGFVQAMVRAAGGDPSGVGTHGLRRGGATAALAAGIDPETIRMLGRWDSRVYQTYARMSRQAAMRLSAAVASTPFTCGG